MISRALPKIISGCFALAAAILLCVFAPFGTAQTSGSPDAHAPHLDYEFFKTRVEPIFLKSRSADHARCYVCHQVSRHGGGPLSLDLLSPGMSFWTEEQSRHNFEVVSKQGVLPRRSRMISRLLGMWPRVSGVNLSRFRSPWTLNACLTGLLEALVRSIRTIELHCVFA